jgi:hypothetical protein
MNYILIRRLRLSIPGSLALAMCAAGFGLALWQLLTGGLENLEALRYAGAAAAFLGARLLAAWTAPAT